MTADDVVQWAGELNHQLQTLQSERDRLAPFEGQAAALTTANAVLAAQVADLTARVPPAAPPGAVDLDALAGLVRLARVRVLTMDADAAAKGRAVVTEAEAQLADLKARGRAGVDPADPTLGLLIQAATAAGVVIPADLVAAGLLT